MSIDTTNLLKEAVEAALSEILPELSQVFKQYKVSNILEIHLADLAQLDLSQEQLKNRATCCFHSGLLKCNCNHVYGSQPQVSDISSVDHLSIEEAIRFSNDIGLKLTAILPRLSQFSEQLDQNFEVQFLFDPAIANSEQPVVCQYSGDSLRCEIGKCSNS